MLIMMTPMPYCIQQQPINETGTQRNIRKPAKVIYFQALEPVQIRLQNKRATESNRFRGEQFNLYPNVVLVRWPTFGTENDVLEPGV